MGNIWLWVIIVLAAVIILYFTLRVKKGGSDSEPENPSIPESPESPESLESSEPMESSENSKEDSSEEEKPM
jgi:hypothetical protein